MSSTHTEVRLVNAYYAIMKKIPNDSWNEFARKHLCIDDSDIDDITRDHSSDVKEQKYQMLRRWQSNLGEEASVHELNRRLKEFLPNADLPHDFRERRERRDLFAEKDSSAGQPRVVLFFHHAILPQAELAKKILTDKDFDVRLHCCDRDTLDCGLEEDILRVFVITGKFTTENWETYADILKCSPLDSTLLITRKNRSASTFPETIPHFQTHSVAKSMRGDEFARIITEFVEDRKFLRSKKEDAALDQHTVLSEPESCARGRQAAESTSDMFEDCHPQQRQKYENELKKFDFPDGKVDGKLAYILITSPHKQTGVDVANIVTIPWIKVFDFDPRSRVTGFLSRVEEKLRKVRYFTTSDTTDKIEALDVRATNWVFINGYTDTADSKPVVSKLRHELVYKHCTSLVSFCTGRKVPVVLVLWYPPNKNYDENLDAFITALQHHFMGQSGCFKSVICMAKRPDKHSTLGHMIKRCNLEESIAVVPFNYLCWWLKKMSDSDVPNQLGRTLPQFSEKNGEKETFNISDSDFKWLGVCFEVLGSNEDLSDENVDVAEGEDFLKGGKLGWGTIATGEYDAKRDILNETKMKVIKQYIDKGKSGIVTIFHPPGGGGTTFARRLLWELRKEAPCMELYTLEIDTKEVKNRLRFIRNEAHLPAVVLIDGNSTNDVKTLLEYCRSEKPVILHVQRFYSFFKNSKRQSEVWLPGHVSSDEADLLMGVFSKIKPGCKNALMKLTNDVKGGVSPCMFEYGLTTFDAEFRGLKSYVHGNLQIGEETELKDWHKVLAYLALANYYGNCGLPSKLFGKLLGKEENAVVNLEDIPHCAQKFVIEDQGGEWKIAYFIVAKEILEQVLVERSSPMCNGNLKYLSDDAKANLGQLAIQFIHFVQDNLPNSIHIPSHIQVILTKIFIHRNNKDAGENDEFESKSKFSRLVADAKDEADGKLILLKLVECFPSNAEFHAHLGRFHGLTKDFSEGETCLKKAVEVRTEELEKHGKKPPQCGDAVLCRIYSMFGTYLKELVKDEIYNCNAFDRPPIIKKILETARKSVETFQKSQLHVQIGCSPTYVLLGETKVRLLLADLAQKISHGNIAQLRERPDPYNQLYDFVTESFSHCDRLLVRCMHDAEKHNIPRDDFNKCINRFNMFYTNANMALKSYVRKDKSVHSKACNISMIKMSLTGKQDVRKFQIYEQVKKSEDLNQIIQLYNGVFNDVRRQGLDFYISNYMLEWLQAIRHPLLVTDDSNTHVLTKVKSKVEQWDARHERGSLSKFYNYVLTTLLAINGPRGEVSNAHSEQASKLEREMKDIIVPHHMERSIEWLAKHNNSQSFRNLVHRNLLGEWDETFWKDPVKVSNLRVCKGKIIKCDIWYGHIVLDGCHQPQITVYFNPKRYKLSGSAEKQKTRVEFYIGFNPNHGAEAYEVKVLKKFSCPRCDTQTEISTLGKDEMNHTGNCPNCDEIVHAPDYS